VKRPIYVARGTRHDDVVAVDAQGATVTAGTAEQLAEQLHGEPVTIYTTDSQVLVAVAGAYVGAGHFDRLSVAMRGSGSTGVPAPLSIACDGMPASWRDPSALVPESNVSAIAELLGHGAEPAIVLGGELRAKWLRRVVSDWVELVGGELGTELAATLASTAAKLGIPRTWRNAHAALARRSDTWEFTRSAYYGGRVQCLQPSWTGEAVEYDLRSAYGWALTQPLPDWKIYERRPLPRQPAWYDCDVLLTGDLGPLPVRDDVQTHRLSYPTQTKVRGIWTREDLERSGVGVLKVHRVLSGRWSLDLAPTVSTWLERRETVDAPRRALYRGLANTLAGKLCQKATGWALWSASAGEVPPAGAVPLSVSSALWAVPVPTARQPVTCPQAGSYVTALVRSRVWPELTRPDAIYSDTDSIHLPASAPPPKNCGEQAGQWAAKVHGEAEYLGVKNYRIGSKTVRPPALLRQFTPRGSRRDVRDIPQF
jgi:hypothetical protein